MTNKNRKYLLTGFIATLSGCASIPDATITYYLPNSTVNVTVIQTVSCINISKPIVETAVEFTTSYTANLNKGKTINFSDYDAFYASGNADITLSPDGRIESFNSNSTGSGSEVLATFVSILDPLEAPLIRVDVKPACKEINRVAGEKSGKPLPFSVVLKSSVIFLDNQKSITAPFRITQYPQSFYDLIIPALGNLKLKVSGAISTSTPVETTDDSARKITLVEPAIVPIEVVKTDLISNEPTKYLANVPVPQWGLEYGIPIPKLPMFGTNSISLSLHDSGKIKILKYTSINGAKDLGAAFSALSDKFSKTDSEKAASLKSEADVIAQQQRLIKCKATPEECK